MKTTLAAVVLILGLVIFFDAGAARADDDSSDVLASYLNSSEDGGELKRRAKGLLDKAQVVSLRYEREEPSIVLPADAALALSLKCSHAVPISQRKEGKIYPAIEVVFSRFFGEAEELDTDEWLRQMKRPITAGYRLKSADVVVNPSREVLKKSFELSQNVMSRAASALAKRKGDFPQLEALYESPRESGSWSEEAWPRYPHLTYSHDVGPERKGGREQFSADWCEFRFGIAPISGNPRQRPSPIREYAKQGIVAEWRIESGSERLNTLFHDVVRESLQNLDAFEEELREPAM